MNNRPLLLIFIMLSLTALACGVTVDLPGRDIKTGPTVIEDILISVAEPGEPVDVAIDFGAGELNIQPGAETALIEGTVRYNVKDFKPEITIDGSSVRLETGNLEISGLPTFGDNFINEWNLQLADVPMNLMINSGAYKGEIELGGLSLLSLEVTDGAADVDLRFSEPNRVKMDTLRYQTGASAVKLRGLGNANIGRLIFKSGAGDYTLDFSGELQADMDVTIDSGMSSIELIVPKGVPVEVRYDGGLSNVDYSGDWRKSGNDYVQEGTGPGIIININLGAGNLRLRNR
jgi:hypothetical protein